MRKRLIHIQIFCLLLCTGLGFRLVDLQIFRRDEFRQAAEENRIRIRAVRAPRGEIFDQNGTLLASNRLSHDLTYVAAKGDPAMITSMASRIGAILGEETAPLEIKMKAARRLPLWAVVLARDVTDSVLNEISWEAPFLPGIEIADGPTRMYPEGKVGAHALGYIGEISLAELESFREQGYRPGDWIGKAGIERKLDTELRGVDGLEQFEADPMGHPLRLLAVRAAVPGSDIRLSLDADLCRWANESLAGKEGVVVGIEPATGRILCIASNPGFDPEIFTNRRLTAERVGNLSDSRLPLYPRPWMATFAPGSTFKLASLIAGLASGRITPATRFTCGGSYRGKHCWKPSGHGTLALIDALAQSCDVYFYHLGDVVGIDQLVETARGLGVGVVPGLGLGPERSGVMPTPEWERANVRGPDAEHWGTGDLANTVIGQGYVLMSPIQVARLAAAAALGGRRMALRIIDRIENHVSVAWQGAGTGGRDSGGGTLPLPASRLVAASLSNTIEYDAGLDSGAQRIVRQAMLAVVERGTAARYLRFPEMPVGAKTGTAQNIHGADHAWITAVAPMGEGPTPVPRLALAVLIVHGGHGSTAAGPVAKYILERWGYREKYLSAPPIDNL